MKRYYLFALVVFALLISACTSSRESLEPSAPSGLGEPQADPYAVFAEAVTAITQGKVDLIAEMSRDPKSDEMADFLRQLYARYGPVRKLYVIGFFKEAGVARAIFAAAHRNGPFLWDVARSPDGITMLAGSANLEPYFVPVESSGELAGVRDQALAYVDLLNEGKALAVFEDLICNCMTAAGFVAQVNALNERAGKAKSLRHLRTDTLPGMEDVLRVEHFVSERPDTWLGFHLSLWKTDAGWKLNSVNWTEREVAPKPVAERLPEAGK